MNPKNLVGDNTNPAAELMSSGVSILLVIILFFAKPKGFAGQLILTWLLIHLGNHFYVGLKEMEVPVCPECGKRLINETYQEHAC